MKNILVKIHPSIWYIKKFETNFKVNDQDEKGKLVTYDVTNKSFLCWTVEIMTKQELNLVGDTQPHDLEGPEIDEELDNLFN
jgi:hypothetical protein